MKRMGKSVFAYPLVGGLLIALLAGGHASAGLGEIAMTVGKDLAVPLAQHFGVPAAPVQALFQKGLSVEGVVQALLMSQASKTPVEKVDSILGSNGNDLNATAKTLDVPPSAYGEDKVASVMREVTASQGTAAGSDQTPSASQAKDEAQSATEKAKQGMGSFLRSRE